MEQIYDIEILLAVLSTLGTLLGFGWFVIAQHYKSKNEQKLLKLENEHKSELFRVQRELEKDKEDWNNALKKEKASLELELDKKKNAPLIQESKTVYVKYLHIKHRKGKPVYTRYNERLEENIDVYSEYHYYRFNKYNINNNSIKLSDRSSGIVDLNILYPWSKLTFTDQPSKNLKGFISQRVANSDSYFTATTYYNGFTEGNEDIGMKMEMDTLEARIIVDFSSIIGLRKLFTREPDAYKFELDGSKTKLLGLEKISEGVYHLEKFNMKKDESILIDFHVDWNYLEN